MSLRAAALAYASGLAIATAAWAATPLDSKTATAPRPEPQVALDVPLNWVPDWLKTPLARAIADATDPRDRKS